MSIEMYDDLVLKSQNNALLDEDEANYWIAALLRDNSAVSDAENIKNFIDAQPILISTDKEEYLPELLMKSTLHVKSNPEKFDRFCKDAILNKQQGEEALNILFKKTYHIHFPGFFETTRKFLTTKKDLSNPVEKTKAELKAKASSSMINVNFQLNSR